MKQFLLKISVLMVCVSGVHIALYCAMESQRLPSIVKTFDRLEEDGTDIVYVGDSCLLNNAPGDKDRRKLPEMLNDHLEGEEVSAIAHWAYHPEVFEGISHALTRWENPPKVMVFPINLRAFSTLWDRRPMFQLEEHKYFLRYMGTVERAAYRPLVIFDFIEVQPLSEAEFGAVPVFIEGHQRGVVADYERPVLAYADRSEFFQDQFLNAYGYTLEAEHRKLQATVKTIQILKQKGVIPVVYIAPIDLENAAHFAGEGLVRRIEKNVTVVQEVLGAEGVQVIDLSFTQESEAFYYQDTLNEYLDEAGRDEVSGILANYIREQLTEPK